MQGRIERQQSQSNLYVVLPRPEANGERQVKQTRGQSHHEGMRRPSWGIPSAPQGTMPDDNGGEIDAIALGSESAVEEQQLQAAHILQRLEHILPSV